MRIPGTAPRAAYHGAHAQVDRLVDRWPSACRAGRGGGGGASLAVATLLVAWLQGGPLHAPNASAVYLVAVVAVAILGGTWAAVACSVAAFLLYDFLFIQPVYTFTVAEPGEWLNLVLFLLVAVAIGQLAALQAATGGRCRPTGARVAGAVPHQPHAGHHRHTWRRPRRPSSPGWSPTRAWIGRG